ncbi:MAG: radical SAM protein [Methanococci archaeon]|uniref:Radical SAM domain protein n=1 Tax=Methanocaldococcus vulcanius (strain ATCC 700851 / DSM 12094 / M7) TaxID=579137 RepID=C9RFH1_METVM|nr:radical SAM protein [Methanocaldococcus vulcanius]ACX72323.1 Radical SAM domain protein [Methanocaldococcus vulcanius M7]NPA63052.1 radical SAM protein [Methanococci archaeon]
MLSILTSMIKPKILQVETTNDCNSNCKICMRTHWKRGVGYMSYEDFTKLPISEFDEVALHGWGECFLHPDLFKMVKYIKQQNVKASLCTNGKLLGERLDEVLESGLDEIAFGIFTLDGKEEILKNIEALLEERKKRGVPITTFFDITVFKENLEEIKDIVEKAIELGVDGIVFHRLFDIYNVDNDVKYGLTPKEEKTFFNQIKEKYGKQIPLYFPLKHTTPCRVLLKCMFVRYDGLQSPCVYLSDDTLGDARNSTYKEMLKRHILFIKGVKNNVICKQCIW